MVVGHRTRLLGVVSTVTAVAVSVALLAPPASALAPVRTAAFSLDDSCLGQCSDILPPGQNGSATLVEILANQISGAQPRHADDQRDRYANLALGYPGLTDETLSSFFNDASYDVDPKQVESVVTPRSDVTITRDTATGVPHVRGTTRYGTEYGAGWVGAQDRLWLMDVLRNVGRGTLTNFAGGAPSNRAFEQNFFVKAPYTDADLQAQIDRVAASGPRGAQALADVNAYLDGVNAYITSSRAARNFPGEYVLAGYIDSVTNVGTIKPFSLPDIVAIAGVVGALFGSGGGGEVQAALALLSLQARYGAVQGEAIWKAFRAQDDAEAVATVHDGTRFRYGTTPTTTADVALPDAGSVRSQQLVFDATGSAAATSSAATSSTAATSTTAATSSTTGTSSTASIGAALATARHGMSNALVVSGAHTASGHPVAVFGPQAGYFAPQLLMLQDLQGPGISARGASFAGLNFYVQLGRGKDYSWSATSSSQDITDTYAVPLCNPSGPVTTDSKHYLFRGTCTPMEAISRTNSWKPTTADGTAAGSYRLTAYRTRYGIVQYTGTVGGVPTAFTELRSTYLHEADSIIGFQQFNDPDFVTGPEQFQAAAQNIAYAFNWFYVDSAHTAYYNSGANPVRAATVDPSLPIGAGPATEWAGWDPATNTPTYQPAAEHPQAIDQDYFISWNNKPAPGIAGPGWGLGSVHRGNLLDTPVKATVSSGTKTTRASLVKTMMAAGLTDLRGKEVLPELLAVIDSAPVTDPALATAVGQLRSWLAAGALRTETASGSHVYLDATAIRIMDAWWPLLVQAQFGPSLGDDGFARLQAVLQVDEAPSGSTGGANDSVDDQRHKGSSFQYGWWSYVDKDLRRVLGRTVADPLPTSFCGSASGGTTAACRQVLLTSLAAAVATPAATTYPADASCSAGDQWCADTIVHSTLGGIKHNKIGWQNRPTFQQVVEFPISRATSSANLAAGRTASASSVESSSYPAARAVDSDSSTRWSSSSSNAQNLTVDLGAVLPVGRVVLRWEAAYGKGYRIETSTDGTTWTTRATVTDGNGGVDNVWFTPATARYVRMQGVTRGTSYGYSLYELEVYRG